MSLPAIQLTAITTAAAGAAQAAVRTLDRVGDSFASLLAGQGTAPPATADPANQSSGTINERLSELANRFRHWLGELGLDQPFELKLQVDSFGYSRLDVSGESGAKIEQLLDEHPDWRQQLERLAASVQAQTGGLFTSAVELQVDASSSHIRRLNSSQLAELEHAV